MTRNIPFVMVVSFALSASCFSVPVRAEDAGKKACFQDAKQLCPDDVRALSRSRVRACLIKNIDKTSSLCHSTMLKLKAEHDAAAHAGN